MGNFNKLKRAKRKISQLKKDEDVTVVSVSEQLGRAEIHLSYPADGRIEKLTSINRILTDGGWKLSEEHENTIQSGPVYVWDAGDNLR